MPFARLEAVEHEIHAHYRALRAIRTRKALERSALWASIGAEVRRVLEGVERADRAPARPAGPAPRGRALRAVAWNVQRGARLDELRRAVVAPPFADLMHKLLVTGFRATVEQYLTPETRYERPIFDLLRSRAFVVDGFNDRAAGTSFYNLADPYALDRTRKLVGRALTRLLVRLLRPWNGCVPARLDWFAGRNVTPVAASVARPHGADGRPLSDHSAVIVDIAV
jgi:hypothetical protein